MTVVVALHPHCPCSAATLETLTGLMAHAPSPRPRVYLLFHVDGTQPTEWVESPLWQAGTLPFTRVRDTDGETLACDSVR